jgi:hypothetical protein
MPICAGFCDTKSSRVMTMQFLAILVPHSNTVLNGTTYGATQVFLFISVQKLPICEVRNICLWKNANAVDAFLRCMSEHKAPRRLKKQFFYPFLLLILMQFEIAKFLAASRQFQLAWFRNGDFIKFYKIISFPLNDKKDDFFSPFSLEWLLPFVFFHSDNSIFSDTLVLIPLQFENVNLKMPTTNF